MSSISCKKQHESVTHLVAVDKGDDAQQTQPTTKRIPIISVFQDPGVSFQG